MTSGVVTPTKFAASLVMPLAKPMYFRGATLETAVQDDAATPWEKNDSVRIAITSASEVMTFTSTMLDARKLPTIRGICRVVGLAPIRWGAAHPARDVAFNLGETMMRPIMAGQNARESAICVVGIDDRSPRPAGCPLATAATTTSIGARSCAERLSASAEIAPEFLSDRRR